MTLTPQVYKVNAKPSEVPLYASHELDYEEIWGRGNLIHSSLTKIKYI